MTTTGTLSADDFDAAKAVFEQLKDLSRERQERVLRWISEGLGIITARQGADVGSAQEHLPAPTAAPTAIVAQATASGRDIKSFVAEKAPKSDNQFAAVVAYYYRFEAAPAQRKDTVDSTLLQEAARLAGRRRLAQPRYALNNAKNAGYLDSAGRGLFSINSVGENLVAMALPGDGSSGNAAKPSRGRKNTARKAGGKGRTKRRRKAKE